MNCKYIVVTFVTFLTLIMLYGCSNSEESLQKVEDDLVSTSDVELCIEVIDNFSEDGDIYAVLTIKNLSDSEISYSEEIALHLLLDDEWYLIPNRITEYSEVSYGISAHKEATVEINLSDSFGQIESGTYRIVKPIYGVGTEIFVIGELVI